MTAGEILRLAVRAGVRPGVAVLDLCCGVAGPGRLPGAELDCDYLGVDSSASAVAIARAASTRPPLRGRTGPAAPGRHGRRRAAVRGHARLRGEGRAGARDRRGAPPGRALRLHAARRGRRSRRPSGRRCPTRTRSGSPCSTSWPRCSSGPGSRSRGRRTTAARTLRRRRPSRARSHGTPTPSRRRSGAGRSTSCSPPTRCGASGWTRGGTEARAGGGAGRVRGRGRRARAPFAQR